MSHDDIQMLRVHDDDGAHLVAAAVARQSRDLLWIGSAEEWDSCRDVASVVFDCSSVVQITDPKTLFAMATWLSCAAIWLKKAQASEDKEGDL